MSGCFRSGVSDTGRAARATRCWPGGCTSWSEAWHTTSWRQPLLPDQQKTGVWGRIGGPWGREVRSSMLRVKRVGWFLSAWVVFGSLASAQEITGTIAGTVRDATGAVVPGAGVTIRNTRTGGERRVATRGEGQYVGTPPPLGVLGVRVRR